MFHISTTLHVSSMHGLSSNLIVQYMADQFLVDVPGEVGGGFGPLCCTVGLYVLSRMIPPDNNKKK